jgi:hypothetical protein
MARHTRKIADEDVTARPKASCEMLGQESHEPGLSVAPEDIGAEFLSLATEQNPLQRPWELDREETLALEEMFDEVEGAFDDVGEGPSARDIERRLRRALATGTLAPVLRQGRVPHFDESEPPSREWDELDLTEEAICDASLLDHETDAWGEVTSPALRTEDTHTHGRPRGGHLRRRNRSRRP